MINHLSIAVKTDKKPCTISPELSCIHLHHKGAQITFAALKNYWCKKRGRSGQWKLVRLEEERQTLPSVGALHCTEDNAQC